MPLNTIIQYTHMEEDIPYIQMDLDVEDVRILYSAVNKHLEVWAGGNSEDQANLVRISTSCTLDRDWETSKSIWI